MELTIDTNLIRLFPGHFLVLQPEKQGHITEGGIYRINTPYGAMGSAQCKCITRHALGAITTPVLLMAEGNTLYKERMKEAGCFSLDNVQVCLFTWLRRSSNFSLMLEKEMKAAGIPILNQPQLF